MLKPIRFQNNMLPSSLSPVDLTRLMIPSAFSAILMESASCDDDV